ncbi:dihydrolipoyllysine-residue acetyltransferase component of acetoin cleaving system-like [Oryza brachyantha]|uniref:dihydrolipoyllysine-residue acetyltransferase component of acetoin cleaving system-like n=1 Tax=Oryza brachyantha TaxID=4533 RepID=UPI001AD97BA8|nr:dihydrolipoyllysine-residue acetyltransferase component of acetoin cleaving system-like [Oryza brachyantha]
MGFAVSLINAMFRRAFTSAGLRPHSAVVDDDGTTLHFWAHRSLLPSSKNGAAAAGGSKETTTRRPVVVLVHGFGPDPTWQWGVQVGPLSRHFDLVVPTLLFFGASATRAAARSDAFQAAAVAALLTGGAHLPGLNGADGKRRLVHVVGTSYGGLVARHLARALDGRAETAVGKVVLCDADLAKGPDDDAALAAKGGVAEVTELMAPADGKALRRLMALCVHRPPKFIPECLVRDLLRKYFADKREEKIQLIKGIITEQDDSQLNSPLPQEVLIIWGEFDQIFPVEKAHKVKEILGEKATLKIIPNTGHLAHQEDPKMFNDILLKFLLPSVVASDAK